MSLYVERAQEILSTQIFPVSSDRGVSPEPADRMDTGKITMQTRVAVRDKTPHRFQVIPLREAAKHSPTAIPVLDRQSSQLSSQLSRFTVHVDEQVKSKKLARSMKKLSVKPVLQEKDQNIPSEMHKMEFGGGVKDSQNSSLAPISAQSQGYSHSLNQYSFSLKPWKHPGNRGMENGKLSHDIPTVAPISSKRSVSSKSSGSRTVQPFGTPSATPLHDVDGAVAPTFQVAKAIPRHFGDADDSDAVIRGASNKSIDSVLSKRHAIYTYPDYIPPVPNPGTFLDAAAPLATSELADTQEKASIIAILHAENLDLNDNSFLESGSACPSLNQSHAQCLSPTRPLKLVRTSVPSSASNIMRQSAGELYYPEIVLELMKAVDEAMENWCSI
ncbi:hypothetical protein FA15DRAFT_752775 [Coprinopsis marcescibilis]|uniref:Uncharacterized protein n=1 Tax=Coprinopsis marcescibilis TaxID=230819 RepID=A0A5C3L8F9_COPMA|nr:hypothetical protein FA15DRAFT_752775 [Coprinopsis marcescibilis]